MGYTTVLILVLMEDTLRAVIENTDEDDDECLNPCFNGRYSQSLSLLPREETLPSVLILVLMEDTLRANPNPVTKGFDVGLNPCFNGRYSQSEWVAATILGICTS